MNAYSYDPSALREVFEQHFTFVDGFLRNTHRYRHRPALVDARSERRWTYEELGRDVERLAAGFHAHGVGAGDVVVFQLFNSPEFALCYLAAQRLGAVASPINFRFSSGETAHVLNDSQPRVFVYSSAHAREAREALDRASHQPTLVVEVNSNGETTGARPLDELLEEGGEVPAAPPTTTWDESTRLYTSGTTGMPKGVSLPSLAEVLTAHDVIMHFPLTPEDVTLNMTPWFHRGGISPGGPNAVFYVGASSVTMSHFDPHQCLDLVEREGLTFLIGAPTNLAMLAEAQETKPRDLSSLRGIVTMGAPLERAACLRYQALLTPRIFNGYGTTEAFWNTFLRPNDLPEHAGTAGRACVDDDVAVVKVYDDRLAEPDDRVAQDGRELGEVIVRSVKSGYAYVNAPDANERFHGGWFYTRDLASWDEDEYITIAGRKDDMIISGGENVYPVQVEEVLNEHPLVADCIVVGMPDERWGELVVCYVQPAGEGLNAEECDRHCREHPMLADYKRPRAYRFVNELPRTATGKKMHFVVRAEVRDADVAKTLVRP